MKPTLSSVMPRRRSTAVRAMLVAHAASTSTAGVASSSAVAGRRRHRLRLRLVLAAVLTVAVGGTAAALLISDPTTPAAYASWSAVPQTAPDTPPSNGDLQRWSSKCSDLGIGGVAVQGVPARRAAAAAREVLVDRRGDFTFCVDVAIGTGTLTDPLIALAGLRSDGGREKGLNRMWTTVSDRAFRQPAEQDVLVLGGDLQSPPQEPDRDANTIALDAYQVYGLAGDAVTGVDVVLSNGLRITATVHNGLWGAWWPITKGDPTGSRLDVTTPAGTRTVDPSRATLLPAGS